MLLEEPEYIIYIYSCPEDINVIGQQHLPNVIYIHNKRFYYLKNVLSPDNLR